MWEGDFVSLSLYFFSIMRPNESQIKVINAIEGILSSWEGTNDLDSPTHECDINEYLFAECEESLNDSQRYRLSRILTKALNVIREIND